jgi:hypothetical protein
MPFDSVSWKLSESQWSVSLPRELLIYFQLRCHDLEGPTPHKTAVSYGLTIDWKSLSARASGFPGFETATSSGTCKGPGIVTPRNGLLRLVLAVQESQRIDGLTFLHSFSGCLRLLLAVHMFQTGVLRDLLTFEDPLHP